MAVRVMVMLVAAQAVFPLRNQDNKKGLAAFLVCWVGYKSIPYDPLPMGIPINHLGTDRKYTQKTVAG